MYTLEQRLAKARELRASGCNCSQCVVGAFDDMIDTDIEPLMRAAHGFGSGIGATGHICGAVTGATMVLGLVRDEARPVLYGEVTDTVREFEAREGALMCRDLKGVEGRKPCLQLILDEVEMLHNRLCNS
ncbi:MAG: C-GCAxxG-C-C family protein [Duncaniella sp.]|nr:C-GCAxxG-C-C family protein [Duncaniella sp.]